jgi:hypothetical protein
MLKKVILVLALVLIGVSTANADTSNKVLLCHATASDKNPFVIISVSPNAVEAQLANGSLVAKVLDDGSYVCNVDDGGGNPL